MTNVDRQDWKKERTPSNLTVKKKVKREKYKSESSTTKKKYEGGKGAGRRKAEEKNLTTPHARMVGKRQGTSGHQKQGVASGLEKM